MMVYHHLFHGLPNDTGLHKLCADPFLFLYHIKILS